MNPIGLKVHKDRYAAVKQNGEFESWEDTTYRVAKGLMEKEKDSSLKNRLQQAIFSGKFIPAGRILRSAGIPNENLCNCYILKVEDNKESIGKLLNDVYLISCYGGGFGFNVSPIRPYLEVIGNNRGFAPGTISVLEILNSIGEHGRSGGSRRAAGLTIQDVSHPDLYFFLRAKRQDGKLRNFNISVNITEKFIEAVKEKKEWIFEFNGKQYFKWAVEGNPDLIFFSADRNSALKKAAFVSHSDNAQVVLLPNQRADELWEEIVSAALNNGEPGIVNLDLANRMNNGSYFENIDGYNPCGEFLGSGNSACDLGSLVLSAFVDEDKKIRWDDLRATIHLAIRTLDNVIDLTHFPTPEIEKVMKEKRTVGLGTMGLHHMLMKLGIEYGSEASIATIRKVYSFIRDEAYKASILLAKEKGPFPLFNASEHLERPFIKTLPRLLQKGIEKYGIRNTRIISLAPSGTTHNLAGNEFGPTSYGIEPIPSRAYIRRDAIGERVIIDPLLKEMILGNKQTEHVNSGAEISPEDHLRVQSVIQEYVDNSISKTINVTTEWQFKYKDADIPQYVNQLLIQYFPKIKGTTLYMEGSRAGQIISTVSKEKEQELIAASISEDNQTCASGVCEL